MSRFDTVSSFPICFRLPAPFDNDFGSPIISGPHRLAQEPDKSLGRAFSIAISLSYSFHILSHLFSNPYEDFSLISGIIKSSQNELIPTDASETHLNRGTFFLFIALSSFSLGFIAASIQFQMKRTKKPSSTQS